MPEPFVDTAPGRCPADRGPVAVIGAGWSGLAAACKLARAGRHVVLIEAASNPGGRARTLSLDGAQLDNGQHILVGACREVLAQMRSVGVNPSDVLEPLPFGLHMREFVRGRGPRLRSMAPRSTRPRHLASALYRFFGDEKCSSRLAALLGAARMLHGSLPRDLPVLEWLRHKGQTRGAIEQLWDPLCVAVMNTPTAVASARIFRNVLRQTLLGTEHDARLLVPGCPLGELFPNPALARLRVAGADVRMSTRLVRIDPAAPRVFDLLLSSGERLQARQVILATTPRTAGRLLPASMALDSSRGALAALGARSICTVYLHYAKPPTGLPPLTGLLNQHGQWLVPRALSGEPHWLAVVISAAETHPEPDAQYRWQRVARELAATFPLLGMPDRARVICERFATFDARVGIDDLRPNIRTAMSGLYLAGDYCVRGLPSTLEAAVQGGLQAAAACLADCEPSGSKALPAGAFA